MGKHVATKPITVRLPVELCDVIEAQAEAAGESRNLFLGKRIERSILAGHGGRKTVQSDQKAEDELPPLEEE